jgi:hypothetical protein
MTNWKTPDKKLSAIAPTDAKNLMLRPRPEPVREVPPKRAWEDWLKVTASVVAVMVGVGTLQSQTIQTVTNQTEVNVRLSQQVEALQIDMREIKRILMRRE